MSIDNKLIPHSETNKPQTTLVAIKEQLIKNPDVYIAGEIRRAYNVPLDYGEWTEMVEIFVAPVVPLFDAPELNAFMKNMLSLEPFSVYPAVLQADGCLRLGRLNYTEVIGSLRRTIIEYVDTTEPELIQKLGKVVGETRTESTKDLHRKTVVKVYPERFSAQDVHNYQAGLAQGTITRPIVGNMTDHWLEPDQIERLKALHHKDPPAPIKGLLE